jgi:phage terminase large subunit-like protein
MRLARPPRPPPRRADAPTTPIARTTSQPAAKAPPHAPPPPAARQGDAVTAYARAVLAGDIVAGPHVRDAARRHLDDLEHAAARGWRFDLQRAARAIEFFAKLLRLNAGEFEGRPFVLEPWQCFIVGSLFGWVDAQGWRRFRVAYVETGKGSGKSPLAAGIGLLMMIVDGESRAEIYSAASSMDQAKILFRDAVAMVQLSPALVERVRVIGGTNPWNLVFGSSFFRPIASAEKRQSGPRPHCALVDELHEHASDVVLELLRAGFKFRRQPLLFAITNAGVDRHSVCWQYHDKAIKVAARMLEDDRLFSYVCALDEGEDPLLDERCWIKTNPSLGVTIREDYLRDQVREARQMPAKESKVRRLHFCQWVDAASPWISGEAWRAREREAPEDVLALFTDREVLLALDLSKTTDLSALAIAAEGADGSIDAAVEFWTPGDTLAARGEGDSVPYELWHAQGYLHALPGQTIDYAHLARRIDEIVKRLRVRALVFDRYRMSFLRPKLAELGLELPLIEHPQGWIKVKDTSLWMPQSINELEAAILEARIRIVRNPVLTWNAASAVVLRDDQDSRVFSKRKSTGRIDGVVALAMVVGAIRAPSPVFDAAALIG